MRKKHARVCLSHFVVLQKLTERCQSVGQYTACKLNGFKVVVNLTPVSSFPEIIVYFSYLPCFYQRGTQQVITRLSLLTWLSSQSKWLPPVGFRVSELKQAS